MRTKAFAIAIVCLLAAVGSATAQIHPSPHTLSFHSGATARTESAGPIDGTWMYRSYVSLPNLVVGDDASKALKLLFGEGVMTLSTNSKGAVTGSFDMGGGYVLDLKGTMEKLSNGELSVKLTGPGRPNSPTAGWEYDYHGYLMPTWPNGVGQIPAFVGTVIRAKPHDTSPAGVVANFIAVRQ